MDDLLPSLCVGTSASVVAAIIVLFATRVWEQILYGELLERFYETIELAPKWKTGLRFRPDGALHEIELHLNK